jgi:serine/threonine protein kinase
MVLEFAEGGSLNDKIKFGYGNLSKDKVKRYFRDICKAVEYLHSLKYMHRDIKVAFTLT